MIAVSYPRLCCAILLQFSGLKTKLVNGLGSNYRDIFPDFALVPGRRRIIYRQPPKRAMCLAKTVMALHQPPGP
jgi:hypothetical protein